MSRSPATPIPLALSGSAVDPSLKSEIGAASAGADRRAHRRRHDRGGGARRRRLRAFGPVAQIEEECRDTRRVARRRAPGSGSALHVALAAATADARRGAAAVDRGRDRREHRDLQPGERAVVSVPTATHPERLVHIRMGGGSHVSYRQWRDLEQSGACGLAGFNIETSVNWRAPIRPSAWCRSSSPRTSSMCWAFQSRSGRGFTAAEAEPSAIQLAVISHGSGNGGSTAILQ